jgi:hypothetical protein
LQIEWLDVGIDVIYGSYIFQRTSYYLDLFQSLDLGIKPEPKALNPKYPNPYPFSPKPVTQTDPAGKETEYPN